MHKLIGYDRKTDCLKFRFDIPSHLLLDAKRIAGVPADDPDAAWSYPLTTAQLHALTQLLGVEPDMPDAEFFLESFAAA